MDAPHRPVRATAPALIGLAALTLLLAAAPAGAQLQQDESADAHARAGRALLEGGEARIPSPWGLLDAVTLWEDLLALFGRDHLDRARWEFERALELEPGHPAAAAGLAEVAVAGRERAVLESAEAALARALERPDAPVELWLWRGRVAAQLGDPEGAAHARRYAAEGGDASLASLAAARAHFAGGQDSLGAAAYFGGLADPSETAAEAYRDDLGPVVRAGEQEDWEYAGARSAGSWLRSFWGRRAAESGVSPPERVAEHYRRLALATRRYARSGKRRVSMARASVAAGDSMLVAGRDLGLDDRGTVYLLHGEPDRVVGSFGCASPGESWLYRRPEGRMVFHFVALTSGQQHALVGDPAAGCWQDPDAGMEDIAALYEDRASLDPRLGILGARMRDLSVQSAACSRHPGQVFCAPLERSLSGIRLDRLDQEAKARAAALRAIEHDSHLPELGEPLDFYYDVYAFRGAGATTELVAAVALPGWQVPGQATPGGIRYPVDLSFAVHDSLTRAYHRVEASRVYGAGSPLRAGEHLRSTIALSVPAGADYRHTMTIRVRGESRAGGIYGGPLEVPYFGGGGLSISSLVLAEPGGSGWRRGDVELGLVPPRQFPRGGAFALFYELYDVPADAVLRSRITVEPLDGGGVLGWLERVVRPGSGRITLEFEDAARPDADGVVRPLRVVDMAGHDPGAYRVTVQVRVEGHVAERSTEFVVQEE